VNLWFFDHPEKSGIFNLGTGRAQPFNDVARAVVSTLLVSSDAASAVAADTIAISASTLVDSKLIDYVPFPDALRGKYQCYTQADMTALRATGCNHVFADVHTGVSRYVRWLQANS
jgi:ADP-L-glycero-D-manno-heptose 6-epimerase